MRNKPVAGVLVVGSILLFAAALILGVADVLGILSTATLLGRLPPAFIPHNRKLAFVENGLLTGCLLLAGMAVVVSGAWRTARWEYSRILKTGIWPATAERLRSLESHVTGLSLAVLTVVLITASIISTKGGFEHPEARIYIPHYLSNRPALTKLFDFRFTEMHDDIYEPRQLSYLVDMLDAYGVAYSVSKGVPLLLSASYYLMWPIICLLLWSLLRSDFGLDRLTAASLVLLAQTAPCFFFTGTFYRSAKPGATLCALAATILIFRLLRPGEISPLRRHLAVAGASALLFCATLFDMMGVCLVFLAFCHTIYELFRRPASEGKHTVHIELLLALAAAGVAFGVWNFRLAPAISQHLIGKHPAFFYQNGTFKSLAVAPLTDSVWSLAWFLDVWRYFLGNLPIPVLLALFAYLAAKATNGKRWASHAAIAIGVLLVIARLLIARHLPMLLVDVRRSTYGLPFTVAFCILSAAAISAVLHARQLDRAVIQAALIVLLACNLVALPEHYTIMRQGHLKSAIEYSELLLEQLRLPQADVPEAVRGDPVYVALEPFRAQK